MFQQAMFDSIAKQNKDLTSLPIRCVAMSAVGMGIGFGLCGVGFGADLPQLFGVSGLFVFGVSTIALVASLLWFVIAAIITALRRE